MGSSHLVTWRLGYPCGNWISATESCGGSDSRTASSASDAGHARCWEERIALLGAAVGSDLQDPWLSAGR